MTINELNATLPAGQRTKQFEFYQSKKAFKAECTIVDEEVKNILVNELTTVFSLDVHICGRFVAVTMYDGRKDADKANRYKFFVVDCTDAKNIECEQAPSIKEAKNMIRAKLAAEGGTADTAPVPSADTTSSKKANEPKPKKKQPSKSIKGEA